MAGSFIVAGFEDGGDCQRISTARCGAISLMMMDAWIDKWIDR